ncbi:STAS domain-containing protein [Actinoplanes awajinensis]|uniref:STAS domain-containing protein n=1 Tax=Actinoplanes awajinensis subsp. mycoplanecinus TaxID=135947 RepID=A0A101JB70_9ACTN|nr:STAS domain-containing protein [Actinoplanes awajinensis]KUL23553.1 hypothetical protein ADL15_46145 [Actinoplanes awajinensis subsp. mycoplanecinus]
MDHAKQRLTATATRSSPTVVVVAVTGELDFSTVTSLGQQLSAVVTGQRDRLCLDLSGLEFCDVAGLRALLEIGRVRPGTEVTAAGSAVDTVMQLCDLPTLLGYSPGRHPHGLIR